MECFCFYFWRMPWQANRFSFHRLAAAMNLICFGSWCNQLQSVAISARLRLKGGFAAQRSFHILVLSFRRSLSELATISTVSFSVGPVIFNRNCDCFSVCGISGNPRFSMGCCLYLVLISVLGSLYFGCVCVFMVKLGCYTRQWKVYKFGPRHLAELILSPVPCWTLRVLLLLGLGRAWLRFSFFLSLV